MTAQHKSEIIFCLVFAAVAGSILAGIITLDKRHQHDSRELMYYLK